MSQFEVDIIRTLSARSAQPSAEFTHVLRQQLRQREQVLQTNVMPIRGHKMNFKLLIMGLASLVILTGSAVIILLNRQKTDTPTQTAQPSPPNPSTTQTSSLPNQQAQNLEEAKQSLSFTPLLPGKQLNGETLTDIKVGTKNNMLDDSDTIYLTYADSQGTLFKMSQSSQTHNYPSDAEKVSIEVGGEQITANYYKIPEAETGGGESIGGDVSVPTSYIFWTVKEINYEISEFGRVSKAQLAVLASSLK